MGKSKKQTSLDSEKLVVKERSEILDEFHSSELQAFEALRRRGVAMTLSDMISWDCDERYIQQLTAHLRGDPPPNYMKPTLPQVLKADRQVFLYMIRTGVELKRCADGTLGMDTAIFTALQSCEVGFHLLPFPKVGQKSEPASTSSNATPTGQGKGNRWSSDRPQPYKGKAQGPRLRRERQGQRRKVPPAEVFAWKRQCWHEHPQQTSMLQLSAQQVQRCSRWRRVPARMAPVRT